MKIVVIVVVVDEDFVEVLNEFVRSYLVNYDFVDFHRVMIEYYSYELVTMKDVLKLVMNNH
jgi:predicted phosphoribosyltransferase